jgi:hypothetical protein
MRSYVKIYGPPVYDAMKALEKMAVDMPEVCIMDTILLRGIPSITDASPESIESYFGPGEITMERCDKIISKKGELLGEFDFFFEWFKKPDIAQIESLIKQIDEVLEPIGVRYSIVTKEK